MYSGHTRPQGGFPYGVFRPEALFLRTERVLKRFRNAGRVGAGFVHHHFKCLERPQRLGNRKVLKVLTHVLYRVVKRFREHGEAALWTAVRTYGAEKPVYEHSCRGWTVSYGSNHQEQGWVATWTTRSFGGDHGAQGPAFASCRRPCVRAWR